MRARTLAAEMHSGFGALRRHCPMNIEARLPEVGAKVLAEQPEVVAQLARLQAMWSEAVGVSGGPFLFGERFCTTDAMYAPVVMRIRTYGLPLAGAAARYAEALEHADAVARWVADALAEQDFLDFEEPYRKAR
jgi:glutathione S-transferase